MIEFDNVSLMINNTRIIEDVSFRVKKGEFVFLVGPSGAGKSSILRLIHCNIFPTLGNVIVRDEDTKKIPNARSRS